ncbi:hypothetical protein OUZ56_024399 [Daphnia magna]|uniref:Uncharacterized protein n=1 Tax=Daphnia magna TaxID=35525 RepID=A0ABR0B0R5_9CRUS|nr:hypothetical protein OUZ56_024399 [Daphnia magna]
MSILDLQFNTSKLTRVEDLIICKYDEDFGQPIEVHSDVVLFDKDIVMVRLRKPVVKFSECEEPENVSNNGDISEDAESTDFLNSSLEEDRMALATYNPAREGSTVGDSQYQESEEILPTQRKL